MKKIFPVFTFTFFLAIISQAQNIENTVNTDNFQLGNNPKNNINTIELAQNNINKNIQLSNNPPANNDLNEGNYQQQAIQQQSFSIQKNKSGQSGVATFSGAGSRRTNTYTTYGSSGSKHFKFEIKLNKIHIMRRFFNESAIFKAKTYSKIFKSKKHNIRKCFVF